SGSCEVIESIVVQPATAPFPAAENRIDETGEEKCKDEIRADFYTLSNRTRYDRTSSCTENSLEQEVGPVGVATARVAEGGVVRSCRKTELTKSEPSLNEIKGTWIHQSKPYDCVDNNADTCVDSVFEQDVYGVFCLRKS